MRKGQVSEGDQSATMYEFMCMHVRIHVHADTVGTDNRVSSIVAPRSTCNSKRCLQIELPVPVHVDLHVDLLRLSIHCRTLLH